MIFNRHFYRSIAFWLGWGFIGLNVWLGWPVQETKVMWWGDAWCISHWCGISRYGAFT